MMGALFILMGGAMGLGFAGKRGWAIGLLLVTLGLCALMFWHHVTTDLDINL